MEFTLSITLNLMAFWWIQNDNIFENEEPNVHNYILFLRTNFQEYSQLLSQNDQDNHTI